MTLGQLKAAIKELEIDHPEIDDDTLVLDWGSYDVTNITVVQNKVGLSAIVIGSLKQGLDLMATRR